MSYDDVIRLCREALYALEPGIAKPSGDDVVSVAGGVQSDYQRRIAEETSSVAELVKRVEEDLEDYKKLLERYEELSDVEDVDFEEIVVRVDALMDKLDRFLRRQI